ncbi:MAG: hypothetical protein NZT92_18975 [Abditibacteriales bacterium]|nr:hypothetical protein [Abditibacteriales bacterium]MDW8364476.1 hypothetical protein [Abditibacteriales bacterium]
MMRCALTFILSFVGLGGVMLLRAASAQAPVKEVMVYNGDLSLSPYQLKLGGWGSGVAQEVEEVYYPKAAGIKSIKLTTDGPYGGMRLDLGDGGEPLDITPFLKDGHVLLRVLFPSTAQAGTGGIGSGGFPGGPIGGGVGNLGGGGFPGGGIPGMPGGVGSGGTAQPRERKVFKNVRVVFYLERGAVGVDKWKVNFNDVDDRGWTTVDVPFSAMKASPGAGGRVKRILIAGDAFTSFWVGQIKLVVDHGPLNVRVLANGQPAHGAKLKVDEDIEFVAEVDYGVADVLVLWDFDEKDNVDERFTDERTRGLRVKRKFGNADEFKVTVTVIDLRNKKPPLTVQVDVRVG